MWYLALFRTMSKTVSAERVILASMSWQAWPGFLHYAFNIHSRVPTVGASGAIAGVLGAYMVAFPRARVITLVPLFPFFQLMALPALVVLGLWFVFQFFTGALALAWSASGGGVAWWGHVGGFVFGAFVMALLGGRAPARSAAWVER